MKNTKKILIFILSLILIALVLTFISISTYKGYEKTFFYMDTYINIKIDTTMNKKKVDKLFDDIDYIYSSYHKLTDRYNSYEGIINVYYLNDILKDNESIKIDKRLSDIIKIGIEYYDKTDGYFNIASGNLTNTWKEFIDNPERLPREEELDSNINIDDIKLDNNLYTKNNNIKLDLGGITKGYVTDLVGDYLENNGIYSYIINAGGNVKVGKNHNKEYYTVGITNPDEKDNIYTKVKVNNLSVVTSGSYQRYALYEDKLYHHIIDPHTKYPSNYMKSITVISSSSLLSDIYSTYLFLLPITEGLEIVNDTEDIEAIWYVDSDNIIRSDGFNYE